MREEKKGEEGNATLEEGTAWKQDIGYHTPWLCGVPQGVVLDPETLCIINIQILYLRIE